MQRDPENLGDFSHRFNFFTELPILDSGLVEVQLRQVAVWLAFCHQSMPNYSSGLTREQYKVALLSNNGWQQLLGGVTNSVYAYCWEMSNAAAYAV